MLEINCYEDLVNSFRKLPMPVMEDINKRITDWIASGGKITDDYIIKQCKYAERILNSI